MRVLLDSMEILHIPLASRTTNFAHMELVLDAPTQVATASLPVPLGQAIISLWQDDGVRKAYDQRARYQLNDSASYYFDMADKLMDPHYEPNDQDILVSPGSAQLAFPLVPVRRALF